MSSLPRIDVCLCTCRRPGWLAALLEAILGQQLPPGHSLAIHVCDNDPEASSREVVSAFAARAGVEVTWHHEPLRNIARARNRVCRAARGDFVALIDDDEMPPPGWLAALHQALVRSGADGVLGPVRPAFESPPAGWITRGKVFERREPADGAELTLADCRTGNALLRRRLVEGGAPFDAAFALGGEDRDFFLRRLREGRRFTWCSAAAVHETIPSARCSRSYLLGRALLRGQTSLRHRDGDWRLVGRSLLAVPAYLVALPMAQAAGHHHFMRLSIRLCDHLGRLASALRIPLLRERPL